jgi:hypothetical protein
MNKDTKSFQIDGVKCDPFPPPLFLNSPLSKSSPGLMLLVTATPVLLFLSYTMLLPPPHFHCRFTIDDLKPYFDRPFTEAAKTLG